ncbi:kinase-like domain-containing protein [Emericellopsis atlantica]|uniref:non-specific serine/threonine protein kinase n=1 Tax=Emericellopsis atlantica TaxID=2614577 RepID=A0A9P7ZQ80_9HYPO|nr:kinase-like domain-containing protein [Emericellopsis atlantica]KAG9256298.1 kinase-like domain-containing protein [Emericellopsis atlantica]
MQDRSVICGKVIQHTRNPKVAVEMVQKLKHEGKVLGRQSHDHLLKYMGFFEDKSDPKKAMLLTEFCNGGNLDEFIHHHAVGGMKPEDIVRSLHQVSSALEYLHQGSLFHTDVKPKNIFIRCVKPFDVVLGDCADIQPRSYKGKLLGTRLFHSPQIVQRRANCGPSDDVWALGISALAMIDMSPKVMYNVQGPKRKDVNVDYDEYPARCGTHALSLRQVNKGNALVTAIQKMLELETAKRFRAINVRRAMEGQLDKWEGKTLNITPPEGFQQVEFW